MDSPKTISVALTAYNGSRFLPAQLDSLFRQTRRPDEIIICDDSPDDLTGKAIRPMLSATPCLVKYFHNDSTLGVNGNFSKAVSLCNGDVIFLCDQDDVWRPEKIEKMAAVLEADPEIGAVFCDSIVVDEELNPLGYSLWTMCEFSPVRQKMFHDGLSLNLFLQRAVATGHNIAFRSEFRDLLLPFLPQLTYDIGLNILLACVTRWEMLNEKLTLYRVHSGNVTNPGKRNLKEQSQVSAAAMKNNKAALDAEFFAAIIERLRTRQDAIHPDTLALLDAKLAHAIARASIPPFLPARLPVILREVVNRRYFLYSNGWKSVLADLFLRSGSSNVV